MNNFSFSRIQLAIIAIIIFALFVNVFLLFESIVFPEIIRENISGYLDRFTAVRPLLPGRGIVGYISDDLTDEHTATTRIYLAQYALPPLILVRSLHYPLIVGNFRHSDPDLDIYRKQGLVPLRDFGNGVVLFKREPK